MKKGTLKFVLVAGIACVACDKDKAAPTPAPSAALSASATVATTSSSAPAAAAAASADNGPACDTEKTGDCETACLGGRASACGFADALLRRGPDDAAKRAKLNQKGCELGDGKSCSRLGSQYDKGDGVAKDPLKAVANWELACSKDYGNGCYSAGGWYGDPIADRPQDLTKAATLLAKGCTLGVKASCEAKDNPIAVVEIEDVAASPAKFEGKHVYIKNVAVRRNSPTSGVTLKPGGSPAVDGIASIVADGADDTRRKWLKLPTPVKGVTVTFVDAKVEKQTARDERARLVVMDIGDVVP